MGENICKGYENKGLISKGHEELIQLNIKKKSVKKWAGVPIMAQWK